MQTVLRPAALCAAALGFLLPFERLPSIQLAGTTVRAGHAAALSLLILAAVTAVRIRWRPGFGLPEGLLAAFWIWAAGTASLAPDRRRAAAIAAYLAGSFLVYAVLIPLLADPRHRRTFESAVLAGAAVTCAFGLFQFFGDSYGLPASFTGLRPEYQKAVLGFPRVQSTALEPLYFSNYLLVPFFMACVRALSSPKRGAYLGLAGLIAADLALGVSRGAIAAAASAGIGLTAYMVVSRRRYAAELRRLPALLAIIFTAALGSALLIRAVNGERAAAALVEHAAVNEVKVGAPAYDRVSTAVRALELFGSAPVTGRGLGSFGVLAARPAERAAGTYPAVNNEYLELLAETGAVGGALFAAFLFASALRLGGRIRRSGGLAAAAAFAGIAAVCIQYVSFSTLYVLHVWVFLGYAASFGYVHGSRLEAGTEAG